MYDFTNQYDFSDEYIYANIRMFVYTHTHTHTHIRTPNNGHLWMTSVNGN